MKKISLHIVLFCAFLLFSSTGRGTVTSITVTPGTPTTMSNGLGYYLAGKTYTFTVNVIDPDVTAWGDYTELRVRIPGTTDIEFTITPDGTDNGTAISPNVSGTANITWAYSGASTFNNFTVTFSIHFRWDTANYSWAAGNTVFASCTSSVPASNTLSDTQTVSYGISSQIQLLSMTMTGEGADGYLNKWHDTFNLTGGEIVYNIPGAVTSDSVRSYADNGDAEITGTAVRVGGVNDGTDADETDGISAAINSSFFQTQGFADNATQTVLLRVSMATGTATVDTSNSLSLTCNMPVISDIIFTSGGGIDSDPSNYFRSVNITGTQVTVTAALVGGGAMNGNTTFEVWDTTVPVKVADVVIATGSTSGTATLTYPTVTAGNTDIRNYLIYNIHGGAYGSTTGFGQYHDDGTNIAYATAHTIYWDNVDPPGNNASTFTTAGTVTSSASTIYLNWSALNTGAPNYDADFESYKIYYKKTTDTTWTIIDENTSGHSTLGTIGTTSDSITGLPPLTDYDYMISAVDIFGNEVDDLYKIIGAKTTAASSVTATISDGITSYGETDFASDPIPNGSIDLRRSAIKIDLEIITAGNIPSDVEIIYADNSTDGTTTDILSLPADQIFTATCSRTGANTWSGYVPTTNSLNTVGTSIRFIVKTTFGSGSTYDDYDSELNDGNYTDHEWRFYIATEPTFTPWPARILNNVITDKNPVAYPAYYLTDDAYVTITVYDIKGRPVVKLLDNAFRKSGQNVKESGWRGTNKHNRKLGIGLYYVHFKAKRASDGKLILNKFKKVVMRR